MLYMARILCLVLCGLVTSWTDVSGQPPRPPRYGPWHRDLYVHESADGLEFGKPSVFVERAGVPAIVRDGRDRLIAVFQWFPFDRREAFDRVAAMISSDDGRTWDKPQPIEVKELPDGYERPYDPTIVQVDENSLRLYFTSRAGRQAPQAIYSAIGRDGVHFAFEPEMRFGVEDGERRAFDCAVARIGSTWHLYAPVPGRTGLGYHAVSEDGLKFKRVADVTVPGQRDWLGNVIQHNNGLRFYGSGREGGWVAFSKDGATWELEMRGGQRGADPGVVQTKTGHYLRIYTGEPRADADRVQPRFRPGPFPPPSPDR